MKWLKLETNFLDSDTGRKLFAKFGDHGVMTFLRLLLSIGKEIHDADDVAHANEFGWTKSLKDWAACTRSRPNYVKELLIYLDSVGKIAAVVSHLSPTSSPSEVHLKSISSPPQVDFKRLNSSVTSGHTEITVIFKNIHEFVDPRALSSKARKPKKEFPGYPDGDPRGALREDKRRENKNPPYSPHMVKSIGSMPRPSARQSDFQKLPRDEQQRLLNNPELLEQYRAHASTPSPSGGSSEGNKE